MPRNRTTAEQAAYRIASAARAATQPHRPSDLDLGDVMDDALAYAERDAGAERLAEVERLCKRAAAYRVLSDTATRAGEQRQYAAAARATTAATTRLASR